MFQEPNKFARLAGRNRARARLHEGDRGQVRCEALGAGPADGGVVHALATLSGWDSRIKWGAPVSEKTQVQHVDIELAVVLGRCQMPMQQLLRMGRGAVIPLDTKESDQLWILAAGHPIARGEITIQGDRLCITVTDAADVHEFNAVA